MTPLGFEVLDWVVLCCFACVTAWACMTWW